MDSLRLPPLRFRQSETSHPLNYNLPPITPPPNQTSPLSSTPHPLSPYLPTPTQTPKSSPVTTHPPTSSIRPLPPTTVLPTAAAFHPTPSSTPHFYPNQTPPPPYHPLVSASQHVPPISHHLWPYHSAPTSSQLYEQLPSYVSIMSTPPPDPIPPDLPTHPQIPSLTASNPSGYVPIHVTAPPTSTDLSYSAPSTPSRSHPFGVAKSPLKRTVTTARGLRDMYACPYANCSRMSSEQSNMKAHMRMHTGEKPYVCRVEGCLKAFRWKSSLTYHEKALHVKNRPFGCGGCGRSFVEKRKLKMHWDMCAIKRERTELGQGGEGGVD